MKKRMVLALFAMLLVGNVYGMEEGCPPDVLDYKSGVLSGVPEDCCSEIFSFLSVQECCQRLQLANKYFKDLFRQKNRVVDINFTGCQNGGLAYISFEGDCLSWSKVESLCSLLESTSNWSANVALRQEERENLPHQGLLGRIIGSLKKIRMLDISGGVVPSGWFLEAVSEKKPEFLKFSFGSFDAEKFKIFEECKSICGITVQISSLEVLKEEEKAEQLFAFVNNFGCPVSIDYFVNLPSADEVLESFLGYFISKFKNLKSFSLRSGVKNKCCLSGGFLEGLCTELEVLDLHGCELNESHLCDCLGRLTMLKKLALKEMPIKGEICSKLSASIEDLYMGPFFEDHQQEGRNSNIFVFENLKNCFGRLPNLKKLTIRELDLENKSFVSDLSKGITELTICSCENFNFDGFVKNVCELPKLRRLCLNNVGLYCGKDALERLRSLRDDYGISVCLEEELFCRMGGIICCIGCCDDFSFSEDNLDEIGIAPLKKYFGDGFCTFYDKCMTYYRFQPQFLLTIEEVERIYDIARVNVTGYEFSEEEKIARIIEVLESKLNESISSGGDDNQQRYKEGIERFQTMLKEKKR